MTTPHQNDQPTDKDSLGVALWKDIKTGEITQSGDRAYSFHSFKWRPIQDGIVVSNGMIVQRPEPTNWQARAEEFEAIEAAHCPEDVGLDEYIGILKRELSASQAEALEWRKSHKILSDAILTSLAEARRLREALERINDADDAPDIDLSGDTRIGVHCGVEDIGAQDRYQGADYGYGQGIINALQWASDIANEALSPAEKGGEG